MAATGEVVDLLDLVHHKTRMEEQNQDPAFNYRDHYKMEVKEEKPDPDFTDQHPFITTAIKEENQDHYKTETKEENPDSDLIDQNTFNEEIKEENEDPDHRSTDPAGSSEQQVGAN